jgi:hypothetical protein
VQREGKAHVRVDRPGAKCLHKAGLVDAAKGARLDLAKSILGHDDVDNPSASLEAGACANDGHLDLTSSGRIQLDDLAAIFDETGMRDFDRFVEVVPVDYRISLLPHPGKGNEIVDRPARLHKAEAEVGMLVEDVPLFTKGEVVDMITRRQLGVVGEGRLEDDLGRCAAEVHDGCRRLPSASWSYQSKQLSIVVGRDVWEAEEDARS